MIKLNPDDLSPNGSNLIASILKKSNAWLGESDRITLGDPSIGQRIVENYPAFYDFKNAVICPQGLPKHQVPRSISSIVVTLLNKGLIKETEDGVLQATDQDGHAYINGGGLRNTPTFAQKEVVLMRFDVDKLFAGEPQVLKAITTKLIWSFALAPDFCCVPARPKDLGPSQG